jgi:hypothetical protein
LIVTSLSLPLLMFQVIIGVPPVSSSASETADVVALLRHASLPKQAILYELGSGWGSLVIALASSLSDS